MNRVYVACIFAVCLLAATATFAAAEQGQGSSGMNRQSNDRQEYYDIASILGLVNAAACLVLVGLYLQVWRAARSEFALALVILVVALLVHSLASNPLMHRAFGFEPAGLGPFVVLSTILTSLALGALAYLATR